MKKLLARLEVYVDMDEREGVSGITQKSDTGTFELNMYPNQNCMPCTTRHEFQTIMAHELGHFVARVTKDPTHNDKDLVRALISAEGNMSAVQVPGEQKAWDIAHTISPDLDTNMERACMKSYTDAADRFPESEKRAFKTILELLGPPSLSRK